MASFTIEQFLELCGWIAIVVTAIKGIQFLFSITPTGKLKAQVDKNTQHIAEDFERFKSIEKKIIDIELRLDKSERERAEEARRLTESLNIIGASVASILNHMIDGNGIEEMKSERDRLINHFINK